jgi:hypothetical protein
VTPAGPGFPQVAVWIRLVDEPELRFLNDGMRGLPLNPIPESFGVRGGRRGVDSHSSRRPARAAGQFNGFVMGLR